MSAVEVRYGVLLVGKALIDEKVFLIVSYRVAEVHVNDLPAVALELMGDYPMKTYPSSEQEILLSAKTLKSTILPP